MRTFSEIHAITRLNLSNLVNRLGTSLIVVVGIGGVVGVLVSMLAMAQGFIDTVQTAGSDDRAILLRVGSSSELNGGIFVNHASIISSLPGIARENDEPLAAIETYVTASFQNIYNGKNANVPVRGVSKNSFRVRPEILIESGRKPKSGLFELIVGRAVAKQYVGLDLGSNVNIRNTDWQVVGHFSAAGSVFESEIWGDINAINNAYNRDNLSSSMLVQLQSTKSLAELKVALANDRRLNVKATRESTYYVAQSQGTGDLITQVGLVVAVIMSVGALFAALNTLYSAVSTRAVEIAILRALGFGTTPIVFSVMAEALLLALVGGILGATLSYLFFNGYTASTMGGTYTQVFFKFQVSLTLIGIGILLALTLGFIGGIFPALSAARLPIATVLRRK